MSTHHEAFLTLSESELPEYRARGVLLRHRKTGCEVYHVLSSDEENTFAFVFRTPPRDGTGVAHIVEHSVLCGSERYPVKDSFLVMARRSLATFLNAFTYPDKTVYPAASAVRADYYNLMSVYGDAVFFPTLSEDTFAQEAHHLELGPDGNLEIKGVVYNEMRGDYSSADSLAGTACATGLFGSGHPYSFDSGGDPEAIPRLDHAAFRDFWERHYHPSNCRIFLHGNLPTGEQLAFLEENFLGRFEARPVDSSIPLEPPRDAPRRIEVPCPVAEGGDSSTQIIVNWLLPAFADPSEALALEVLAEVLLGHDGSPLAKALRDSGLGEDLSPQCGLDSGYRQAILSAGLRGARRGDEAKVEELVTLTVARVAREGIEPGALEGATRAIAFANREIRRGGGTYGLRLMNRALRGWLHGAHPEATLGFEGAQRAFAERLAREPRWLESLASRLVVDNPHRTTVTAYPDPGLLEARKEERRAALEARKAVLGEAGLAAVRAGQERLAALQSAPDDPALLALLPRLRVSDIPRAIESIPRERAFAAGAPVSVHPLFTNGIVYLDLAFPLEDLPLEAFPWLPLLARFVAGAGLPGLPYDRVAELLARRSGGFGAFLEAGSPLGSAAPGSRPFAAWAVFRLKALADSFPGALDLALDLLTRADTGDTKRVGDLLAELGNDVISALVPSGNAFALARAGAALSPALAAEELWRGPSQLLFLAGLREGEGEEGRTAAEVASRLAGLLPAVVSRRGLRIGLTASEADAAPALAALDAALGRLPDRPAPFPPPGSPPLASPIPATASEAWAISAQVGFMAAACRASRLGSPDYAHETVLAHLLTTGALWEEIRVRGGAYGASAYLEPLEGVALFSTYRDPRPVESLAAFGRALEAASRGEGLEAAEEAVVGAAGRDLKPLLPDEKGLTDFKRELFGIDDATRAAKRAALLDTGAEDLRRAAGRLAGAFGSSAAVLISPAEDVESMGRIRPGTRRMELPF